MYFPGKSIILLTFCSSSSSASTITVSFFSVISGSNSTDSLLFAFSKLYERIRFSTSLLFCVTPKITENESMAATGTASAAIPLPADKNSFRLILVLIICILSAPPPDRFNLSQYHSIRTGNEICPV